MSKIFTAKGAWPNGIAIVRVLVGWLIYRYSRELFNIGGLIDFLTDVKVPFPVFCAYAAKIIELVGGICLILGLFTRFVTPLLIIVMLGVIGTMNNWNFYNGELPLLFICLFAVFFFTGPGNWSLDHLIGQRQHKKREP